MILQAAFSRAAASLVVLLAGSTCLAEGPPFAPVAHSIPPAGADICDSATQPALTSGPEWRGADVSFLAAGEKAGARWRDEMGRETDLLELLADLGANLVRIRLWYDRPTGVGSIEDGLAIAARARAHGLALWLDLHYSSTWADPGHQETPIAWSGVSAGALSDSVAVYTARVVSRFRDEVGEPEFVQVGNEVSSGMLWPSGRIQNWDDRGCWDRFCALWNAGANAVRETAPECRVILHLDPTPGPDGVLRFLSEIRTRGGSVDGIALSYYPWWHGSLSRLDEFIRALDLAGEFWYLAEVAYPWSPVGFDSEGNVLWDVSSLPEAYGPSASGQARFLGDLRRRVEASSLGMGILYWAPEWVSAPRQGSPWENCALFDASGRLLPGARVLFRVD